MAKPPTPKSPKGGAVDTIVLPTKLVKGVASSTPASGKDAGQTIFDNRAKRVNTANSSARTAQTTSEALKLLGRINGEVALAVNAQVRLANTTVQCVVFDSAHQVSVDGANLLRSLMVRFGFLPDYTYGFDDRQAPAQVKESLLLELAREGAAALELVLDDQRIPERLQVAPVASLKWKAGGKKVGSANKLVPFQVVQGEEVLLDIPTFFYASIDQDPSTAYAQSPLEAAWSTSVYHDEVLEDIRRVVKRTGHSRLTVSLVLEKLMKAMPADYRMDPKKSLEWLEGVRDGIKEELENLSPESALVFFDTAEPDYLNSEVGASSDYTALVDLVDGKQSAALHTPPAVLGKRSGGSQNTSSTESLIFIQKAKGFQPAVETLFSRAFTLAVRLMGFDGYVVAKFEAPNLRPELETEAFKQQRQTRIIELWSLGVLSDDQAAEELGYGPRDPGAPSLSGTLFHLGAGPAQTTAVAPNSDAQDPVKRAATTDKPPTSAGGRSNQKR